MTKQAHHIVIPDAIMEDLDIKDGEQVEVTLKDKEAVIRPKQADTGTQTISLRFFLIPSILSGIIFLAYFFYFKIMQVPMTGKNSIAQMVIVLGELSGMSTFAVAYIRNHRQIHGRDHRRRYWRIFPTLLLSFAIILAFVASVFFWAIGYMFEGVSFDIYTATGLFFIFISIVNYLMIYSALSISTSFITTLFLSTFVGGVVGAIVTNSSRQWWQHNVSFLGTSKALNAWQFNLTIAVSALLWIALVDYLFVPLMAHRKTDWRLITLRILLTVAAIALLGVGLFPNNRGILHVLHTQSAWFLNYFLIGMIIAVRWLLPGVSREFLSTSYTIGGIIILAAILFQFVHYLSLTAFEMIAFALAMSWIMLLLQNIHRLYQKDESTFIVTVTSGKEKSSEKSA
ncbi:transcriptional regulator [Lacticaseibacillus casei]|uniref:DUF998 domain-containing protein n=1 Tax=Lacticaseibacillus zeae TaxID=57037 RepID=A0A5R8LXB7_LACZE|nr:AbrB/MazE/SpoVT family DNA-binding domain-containing protein [Lacticaseibacillus zeae]OLS10857.1 transcriptional regulator [Lacticaseibacillus casei]QVI31218.1 DUF998 domain-containing protein [Lacticaseibacillus zeae]TLF41987.1 DUF998 domain-containing protein [Lacticaseibacillus zeae]